MCGIAGKVVLDQSPVRDADIQKMTDAIAHRGPDDAGVYVSKDKRVGLGHRRLAIIDLSPLGHQPMTYKGRYQIVFNGEIYNFAEKREALLKQGYAFKSNSDTEVILALYDKYRAQCVDHLRGMFAFAIYDEHEQVLFCARDRVGKKPFKYYWNGTTFVFASELKAILTQREYAKSPDMLAVHHYLTYQYCPAPFTGFTDIQKLPAGYTLTLDCKAKTLKTEQYWHLDYTQKLSLTESEWQTRIIEKLREAVQIRMVADVPVGAFLSGGIDSSAVVAFMSEVSQQPVKTFSIGFTEQKYSELKYAKMVADRYGTDHTEFIVEPKAIEVLPLLVKHYEEPYADSSGLATYYVSKLTREHVTVALNGDGGDENFAGYGRYSVQKFGLLYDHLRLPNKILAEPATRLLAQRVKTTLFERAHRFSKTFTDDYRHRYVNYICYFTNERKRAMYTERFAEAMQASDSYDIVARQFDAAKTRHKLDQTLYADFTTYLPDDLLVKVDIATMAVALEGRSPFLDHELLELTAQIPFSLKLKGANNKKHILKKALEPYVPHEVMYRPKMGFGIPIEQWFRHELKDYVYDNLLSDRATERGIFRRDAVESLLDEHCSTQINYSHLIWALLTLELWFQEYFDA